MKAPFLFAAVPLVLAVLTAVSPSLGIGTIAAIFGLVLYFLPSIVANANHKRNAGSITVLNVLLGWTLIGWVVALVWATTHDAAVPVTQ